VKTALIFTNMNCLFKRKEKHLRLCNGKEGNIFILGSAVSKSFSKDFPFSHISEQSFPPPNIRLNHVNTPEKHYTYMLLVIFLQMNEFPFFIRT